MASNISKIPRNMLSNPNLDAADTGVDPSTGRLLSKKERVGLFKKRKINAGKVFGKKDSKTNSKLIKRGRPKKLQTLAEVKAAIDAKNPTYVSPITGGKLPGKGPKIDSKKLLPENKILNDLVKQVQNNSKKITLLKNIVKLNIEKVSKILVGDAEKKKKEQREDLRQQQLQDDDDNKKKKEGLLEGVGKSVGKTLLKPVQKVAKAAKNIFSQLGNALLAIFGGFVANKAIRMIQAKMSGDTETFKQMRNEMFKGLAILGGIFAIMSRGFMIIPDLIFGSIRAVKKLFGAVKKLKSIFKKGLGGAAKRAAIAVGGKKAAKTLTKKVGKEGAEKIAKEGAEKVGKQIAKQGAKKVAKKGIAKGLAKKIPLLGLGLGAVFAAQRAMAGDFAGAAMELASGAASTVPGLGTAASVAIDAALIAKDVGVFGKKDKNITPPPAKTEISTLDESEPKIIDMTTKGSGSNQSTQGNSDASTGLPNVSSSNSDNNHVVYSKTQYNLIGV